jgi:hypothetical protein
MSKNWLLKSPVSYCWTVLTLMTTMTIGGGMMMLEEVNNNNRETMVKQRPINRVRTYVGYRRGEQKQLERLPFITVAFVNGEQTRRRRVGKSLRKASSRRRLSQKKSMRRDVLAAGVDSWAAYHRDQVLYHYQQRVYHNRRQEHHHRQNDYHRERLYYHSSMEQYHLGQADSPAVAATTEDPTAATSDTVISPTPKQQVVPDLVPYAAQLRTLLPAAPERESSAAESQLKCSSFSCLLSNYELMRTDRGYLLTKEPQLKDGDATKCKNLR